MLACPSGIPRRPLRIPTVIDLNTFPFWGFPWLPSGVAVTPEVWLWLSVALDFINDFHVAASAAQLIILIIVVRIDFGNRIYDFQNRSSPCDGQKLENRAVR